MSKPKLLRPFINGKSIRAESSNSATSKFKHVLVNPTNAKPHNYFFYPTLSPEIQNAIEGAKSAQRLWASESPSHRAAVLRRAASIMSQDADRLAKMETLDTGRVIRETKYDICNL